MPQVGDEVLYFRSGHQAYAEAAGADLGSKPPWDHFQVRDAVVLLQCWLFVQRLPGPLRRTGAGEPLLLHVILSGSTCPAHNLQQPAHSTPGCCCLLIRVPAWHSKGWWRGDGSFLSYWEAASWLRVLASSPSCLTCLALQECRGDPMDFALPCTVTDVTYRIQQGRTVPKVELVEHKTGIMLEVDLPAPSEGHSEFVVPYVRWPFLSSRPVWQEGDRCQVGPAWLVICHCHA